MKTARKMKVTLRVMERMKRGQKRNGEKVIAMQKIIYSRTKDYGQSSLLINRETIAAHWLIKVQKKKYI